METLLNGLLILVAVVLGYCLRDTPRLNVLASTIKKLGHIPFTTEHIEAIRPKTRADFEQTQEAIDNEAAQEILNAPPLGSK